MKTEKNKLGRCATCKHWRSATDLLAERLPKNATAQQVAQIRQGIRDELSMDTLSPLGAEKRGWCLAAERGTREPFDLIAINLLTDEPARLLTEQNYGCLNHAPRPRRSQTHRTQIHNPHVGRCNGCQFWSRADNEAHALLSLNRYTDPNASPDTARQQAYSRLSPPPLNPATAHERGWCKMASDVSPFSSALAVDPPNGQIGALITHINYGCTRHVELVDPNIRTTPSWRWFVNGQKLHNLGPSASLGDLLWSYLDPATLIDPNHPLSPLHSDHPLNPKNPRSLLYNPNPAFAAYVTNPSLVHSVTDTGQLRSLSPQNNEKTSGPSASTIQRFTLAGRTLTPLSGYASNPMIGQLRASELFGIRNRIPDEPSKERRKTVRPANSAKLVRL